ncbi:L-ribulose-5-phosphate 3-epimerase [Treponema sp.]
MERILPLIGIYEKALPAGLSWQAMLKIAKEAEYDFVEMSIDESDARLTRLQWTAKERIEFRNRVMDSGLRVPSICLSGHRKFPFGSASSATRQKAKDIMRSAIDFALDCGVRTLQLAGYDVYYEESTAESLALFEEGLTWAVGQAEQAQVTLGMEIMDTPLMSSIKKWLYYANKIPSAFFQVYPDIGNLSAWGNNVATELALARGRLTAIHLKDTLPPKPGFPGQFRDLPFGQGCVDFPAAFRALKAIDYRGSYLIEMWTDKAPDPIAEITQAREWIIDKMKIAGLV